jgi:hypothetical protein
MCQEFNKNILIMVSEGSVNDSAYNSIAAIIQKYEINAKHIKIPRSGISDADLQNILYENNQPKYKAIVFPNGRVSYSQGNESDPNWQSAINNEQWEQIYEYSRTTGSRVVFLNEFPSMYTGTQLHSTFANLTPDDPLYNSEQTITAAQGSNYSDIINKVKLSTSNIHHFPAVIQNTQNVVATPLLYFEPTESIPEQTVAAVEVDYAGAKFAAYFMAFGDWSATSRTLNILWISWATGLDLKTLSSQEVSTEEALIENSNAQMDSNLTTSDARRNGKLEMLFVTISTLFTLFYLF